MKPVSWFSYLIAATVLLDSCNSKQKLQSPIEDSVKIDTNYAAPKVELPEEKRVYDSTSASHFTFKNLSRQFNINLDIERFIERDDIHDSCIIKAIISDKKSKNVFDSLLVTSLFFYTNYYDIPSHMVSYSTGAHVFKEPVDNYVGDLAVADFNFDGRDDVALISDMGGNGGPLYSYFVQQPNLKFILDRYLTDSMSYFPDIDKRRKTLTTYVHAGACCMGKHVYKSDRQIQRWKQIEHVILGLPKAKNK